MGLVPARKSEQRLGNTFRDGNHLEQFAHFIGREHQVERPSRSRPGAGIVTFRHELINQRDEVVCQCLRMAMLGKAPATAAPAGGVGA